MQKNRRKQNLGPFRKWKSNNYLLLLQGTVGKPDSRAGLGCLAIRQITGSKIDKKKLRKWKRRENGVNLGP